MLLIVIIPPIDREFPQETNWSVWGKTGSRQTA